MKKNLIFGILAILIMIPVLGIQGATDEGYGENNTALGQYVDSFENMNGIAVNVSVERNATLNAMELNFTAGAGLGLLDYTDFTEVDEDADVTVFIDNVTWVTMRRDAETYLWADSGIGYWGDFYHEFIVNITDMECGDATAASVAGFDVKSNNTGVMDDLAGTNYLCIFLAQNLANDDSFRFGIWERKAGLTVAIQNTGVWHAANDPLYFIHNRTGSDVDLYIFSDSARTVLVASASITGNGDVYRYHEPMANWGRDVDPADHHTGFMRAFNLGGAVDAYDPSGYFTTIDYLGDPLANGSVLVALINSSIPANTEILVQFSNDNATWGDSEGIPLDSEVLIGGFEAFDLRDLNYSTGFYYRFNFSTTDQFTTPRLMQSRIITTIGQGTGPGAVVGGDGAIGILMLALIFIPVIVFLGVRKK